ncbi:hypothetical protein B7494_g1565 [Chlorociboria aeruginascens]|nr:hypothetical protein B7494_g1565 [Chlorociboria aeruginascens]
MLDRPIKIEAFQPPITDLQSIHFLYFGVSYVTGTMKILEAQSAILTNFEVFDHLSKQRIRYKKVAVEDEKRRAIEEEKRRVWEEAEAKKIIQQRKLEAMAGKKEPREPREPPSVIARKRSVPLRPASLRPGNLETVVRELMDYLKEPPSPLGQNPSPYGEHTIKNLLRELRRWDLTKAEILMILNLRPTKPENLNVIIEEMETRFPGDELQNKIVHAIMNVLGAPGSNAEAKLMGDNGTAARATRGSKDYLDLDV